LFCISSDKKLERRGKSRSSSASVSPMIRGVDAIVDDGMLLDDDYDMGLHDESINGLKCADCDFIGADAEDLQIHALTTCPKAEENAARL
jgi:hypothetical protein